MMFDVGLRFNLRSAYFFRVHDTILTKFIIKAQKEGKHIFSVIPLFMKKEEPVDKNKVFNPYYQYPLDLEDMYNVDRVADPIDNRAMLDP